MKVLITGGTGYLGSKMAYRLTTKGYEVAILIRSRSKVPNFLSQIPKFTINQCNNNDEIYEVIKNFRPDLVFHAACCYGRSNETFSEIISTNIGLGVAILNSLNQLLNPATFINVGTSLPSDTSLYALTKNEFRNFGKLSVNHPSLNLQFLNLSVEHFYGPKENENKFIPYILSKCLKIGSDIDLTLGEQKRDFIFIDDLINACLKIIERIPTFTKYESISVGSGEAYSIKDIVLLIHKLTESKSNLKFGSLPYRSNEVMFSKADVSVLKKLGWKPQVSIFQGISQIINEEFKML